MLNSVKCQPSLSTLPVRTQYEDPTAPDSGSLIWVVYPRRDFENLCAVSNHLLMSCLEDHTWLWVASEIKLDMIWLGEKKKKKKDRKPFFYWSHLDLFVKEGQSPMRNAFSKNGNLLIVSSLRSPEWQQLPIEAITGDVSRVGVFPPLCVLPSDKTSAYLHTGSQGPWLSWPIPTLMLFLYQNLSATSSGLMAHPWTKWSVKEWEMWYVLLKFSLHS